MELRRLSPLLCYPSICVVPSLPLYGSTSSPMVVPIVHSTIVCYRTVLKLLGTWNGKVYKLEFKKDDVIYCLFFFYCHILLCNNSLFLLIDVVLPTLRLACVVPDALVWWNISQNRMIHPALLPELDRQHSPFYLRFGIWEAVPLPHILAFNP